MNFRDFVDNLTEYSSWDRVILELKRCDHDDLIEDLNLALDEDNEELLAEVIETILDIEEDDGFGTEGMRL